MSKINVIYNQMGVFTSNAPASGFTFLTPDGLQINNPNTSNTIFNLVFPLNRIISTSYSVADQRTEVRYLGKRTNLARPIITPPEIKFNLEYYLMGLVNENRLGFYTNIPSGNPISGNLLYNTNICPLSGFIDRNYNKSNDTPQGWPLTTRDSRNIYVAIKNEYGDLKDPTNPNNVFNQEINVLGFGDCYLTSYKTSAKVGEIPRSAVEFVCDNIQYYSSGSGITIPAVNPQNYLPYSGNFVNLPNNNTQNDIPTVVIPGDMSLNISNYSGQNPSNLSIDIKDTKIQGYDISMTLNREAFYNLGYKLPLDRRINFPVIVELNFDMIVGDSLAGSFSNLLLQDISCNIGINLNYQQNTKIMSGLAIGYNFIGEKFNNISFSDSIGSNKTCKLSFTTEINPDDNINGFFMSGKLGVLPISPSTAYYLSVDVGGVVVGHLLLEDGSNFTLYPSGLGGLYY